MKRFTPKPAGNTYAIYMRPRGTTIAVRHRDYLPFSSSRDVRNTRRRLGPDACIHVGVDHPDELPFLETKWLEK